MSEKDIVDTIKEHSDELMKLPGVVGIGEGESQGRACIKLYVSKREAASEKGLPHVIDGYPVVVEESAEFRAARELT